MLKSYRKSKFVSSTCLVVLFVLLKATILYAQVTVSLNDSIRVCKDFEFSVPVKVYGLKDYNPLIAYQLRIDYNKDFLQVKDVDFINSIPEKWSANSWNCVDSIISVAGFSAVEFYASSDTSNLFTIRFKVKADTVCTDSIEIVNAYFYTLTSAVEAAIQGKSVLSFIHNFPPVIDSIPCVNIFEDSTRSIMLFDKISDENNTLEDLSISILSSQPDLQLSIDTTNWELTCTPIPNWAGSGVISINVADPFGMKDSVNVPFKVFSVPDAPGKFSLVLPEDSTTITKSEPLSFCWNSSGNVDKGDSIFYRFCFDSDSMFNSPDIIVSITDTAFHLSTIPESGFYFWKVVAFDKDDLHTICNKTFIIDFKVSASVVSEQNMHDLSFKLFDNAPNPFNCSTVISYRLPKSMPVLINIFNSTGKLVKTLVDRILYKGIHRTEWNGKDENDSGVSSGVYIVRITAENFTSVQKVLLVR